MMKKAICVVIVLLIALSLLPIRAQADGTAASGCCGDNLYWSVDDVGTLTFSGTGEIIWDESWWTYGWNARKVVIEPGITGIADSGLAGLSELTEVSFPDTLTRFGRQAFAHCSSLQSIKIPGTVQSIGDWAFEGCVKLEKVEIEAGIQSIGIHPFFECFQLSQLVLPEGIERITFGLLCSNDGIKEFTIPQSVKIIEDYAFFGVDQLSMITIPENVEKIGGASFVNTFSLTSVIFEGDAPQMDSPFYCASFNGVMFYPKDNPTWSNIDDILWSTGGLVAAIPYTRDSAQNIIPQTPDVDTVKSAIDHFQTWIYPEGSNYPDNYSYILNGNMLEGYGKEAFAYELSDACFGYLPISEKKPVNYDSLTLGDILYIENDVWVITQMSNSGVKASGVDGNFKVSHNVPLTKEKVSGASAYRTRYGVSPYPGEVDPAQNRPKIAGPDHVLTEEEVYQAIMALQTDFPEGMPYSEKNHYHQNFIVYLDEATNISPDGHGCSAFSGILSDSAFGELPARFFPIGSVNYDDIMIGDILSGMGHDVVVTSVYQDCVIVAEGNYNDGRGGRIHWGRPILREEIERDYALVTRYPEGTRPGASRPSAPHIHNWVNATCTSPKTCSSCGATEGSALGHKEQTVAGKAATCTEKGLTDGKKCERCGTVITAQAEIAAKGHSFKDGKCTVCGAADPNYVAPTEPKPTEPAPTEPSKPEIPTVSGVNRVAGDNRYSTGLQVADQLKTYLGVTKFNAIVVASGREFPDALAGSYLANQKGAPILLVNSKDASSFENAKNYIAANLATGGTVYILGGEAAVPKQMVDVLAGYNVVRLAGDNRYGTNLAILKEAGTAGQEILICTGRGFADSLSASAVNKPILLLNNKTITADQKAFLENSSKKFIIIGGESAISAAMEAELAKIGTVVKRIAGSNRYETSVQVANYFFDKPTTVVVAYAKKFPDGLCGGPLANALKAPLILTAAKVETQASSYMKANGIKDGMVLGGTSALSQDTVNKVFN